MEFTIKSADPKAHLMVCSAINLFSAFIIDSGIHNKNENYGFFTLEAPVEMFESLYHFPGVIIEISEDLFDSEE